MRTANTNGSESSGKFTRESPYAVATEKGFRCMICPHNCNLAEGQMGICRTHVVKDGKLRSTAYGNPCAVHADPIEKKPLFHFLPGTHTFSIATAGCNLGCRNCQNWEISQHGPNDLGHIEMFPDEAIFEAIRNGCKSIAYTYTEPTAFFEYAIDMARLARLNGLKNLFISNGYINEQPLMDLCKYLDAANIDLKSFDEHAYAKLTGGSLKPVLETLKILKSQGVWLEITTLLIPGLTDDMKVVREMCDWLVYNGFEDVPLHFSRFYPCHQLTSLPSTLPGTLESAREIAMDAGIHYVYIGNLSGTTWENTYCPVCKRMVVERDRYAVRSYSLHDGVCHSCRTAIAGVWA